MILLTHDIPTINFLNGAWLKIVFDNLGCVSFIYLWHYLLGLRIQGYGCLFVKLMINKI